MALNRRQEFSWNDKRTGRSIICNGNVKYAERDAEQKLNISDLTRPLLAYLSFHFRRSGSGIFRLQRRIAACIGPKYSRLEVVVAQAELFNGSLDNGQLAQSALLNGFCRQRLTVLTRVSFLPLW